MIDRIRICNPTYCLKPMQRRLHRQFALGDFRSRATYMDFCRLRSIPSAALERTLLQPAAAENEITGQKQQSWVIDIVRLAQQHHFIYIRGSTVPACEKDSESSSFNLYFRFNLFALQHSKIAFIPQWHQLPSHCSWLSMRSSILLAITLAINKVGVALPFTITTLWTYLTRR